MAKKGKSNGRGGARPNAGRPRLYEKAKVKSKAVQLPVRVIQAVENEAAQKKCSVSLVLLNGLEKGRPDLPWPVRRGDKRSIGAGTRKSID